MNFILLIIIILSSLMSVAFYTVLERKILGYIQIRKGPNKVGLTGIFQPFSDAIKLFAKSLLFPEPANFILMATAPTLAFILSILIWPLLPFSNQNLFDSSFNVLAFFIISSISVYTIILMGWSSNSKYCYLGAIRSVAQMISYEVSLFLIIISVCILLQSYNFNLLKNLQFHIPLLFLLFPTFLSWMITCVAETNRSPFDFAEGESELVSGFNVEYMGGWFAFIFLAEYLSMLTLSIISSIIFMGKFSSLFVMSSMIMISLTFLWIRGSFPRFRYDLLMDLNWKIILPMVTSFVIISTPFSSLGL